MPKSPLALAAVAILLTAGSSPAVVAPERSPLESRERRPAGLDVEPVLRRLAQLDAAAAARRSSDLHRLGVAPENALLDARGGRWATLLLAGADRARLADAGVGWVVVEGAGANLGLPVAFRSDDLTVYRVGGVGRLSPYRGVALAAHSVWFLQLCAGLVAMMLRRRRTRRAEAARPTR